MFDFANMDHEWTYRDFPKKTMKISCFSLFSPLIEFPELVTMAAPCIICYHACVQSLLAS